MFTSASSLLHKNGKIADTTQGSILGFAGSTSQPYFNGKSNQSSVIFNDQSRMPKPRSVTFNLGNNTSSSNASSGRNESNKNRYQNLFGK